MALPALILAEEEPIRLLAPWDDAIDVDACRETYDRYVAAGAGVAAPVEDLDASALALRPGVTPTWFTVRALSPREVRLARGIQGDPPDVADWGAYLEWVGSVYLRFGLVQVEGWDGWDKARREPYIGAQPWSRATMDALPRSVLQWLGYAVYKLSTLDVKKKALSGSSPTTPGGTAAEKTTKAEPAEPAPSTAAAAPTSSAPAGESAPQVPPAFSATSPDATSTAMDGPC